jgi:nucleotide-binding universal stress UspA family protein
MDRILITTDGSPSAQEAVDFGIELAADQGSAVTFVHVVPVVDVVPAGASGSPAPFRTS